MQEESVYKFSAELEHLTDMLILLQPYDILHKTLDFWLMAYYDCLLDT